MVVQTSDENHLGPDASGNYAITEPDNCLAGSMSRAEAGVDIKHRVDEKLWGWYPSAWWESGARPAPTVVDERTKALSLESNLGLPGEEPCQYRNTVYQNTRGSRKSGPLAAASTKVHALGGASQIHTASADQLQKVSKRSQDSPHNACDQDVKRESFGATQTVKTATDADPEDTDVHGIVDEPSSSYMAKWHSWWSRPEGSIVSNGEIQGHRQQSTKIDMTPNVAIRKTTDPLDSGPGDSTALRLSTNESDPTSENITARAWLPRWSALQTSQPNAMDTMPGISITPKDNLHDPIKSTPRDTTVHAAGWAFWASGVSKQGSTTPGGTQRQIGELAVADSPSQSHPENVQFNQQTIPPTTLTKPIGKRKRRGSIEHGLQQNGLTVTNEALASENGARLCNSIRSSLNLVQPTIDMYPDAPVLGYMSRVSSYLSQTLRLGQLSAYSTSPCVTIVRNPPKITRAVAIGVHGFYPSPMVRMVLGPPTGTSVRFANAAASEIKAWCSKHHPDARDVEIEKIALEGEGLVADRVTVLWKLLLNWLSHLKQADLIFVAGHSQGVPVACMLVAKLIQLGCIPSNTRLGICAMAGVNLGPFPEYKVRLFGGSALELFDFGRPQSEVSKAYAEALDICLRHGVRITYIGSLDDQLVSLESSLFMPLSHPYVSRAVFINGRLHTSDFLTRLVSMALRLRNLGHSDHGLIKELSGPLAGSLVGGDGHSRLYDDPNTYSRALDFTLRTTDIDARAEGMAMDAASSLLAHDKVRARKLAHARRATVMGYPSSCAVANDIRRGSLAASTHLTGMGPLWLSHEKAQQASTGNPFNLPWAVRGMLEEQAVKTNIVLQEEVRHLIEDFQQWSPTSKALKDVRWRLEGMQGLI